MRLYSVHIRRHGLDIDRDYIAVKEGFCWPAFLSAGLWAAWHRMWWWAPGLLIVPAALAGLMKISGADPMTQTIATMGWSAMAGLLANDLRRYRLDLQGFVEAGMAAGRSGDAALYRFLADDPATTLTPRPPA